jgi:hypothetical protein
MIWAAAPVAAAKRQGIDASRRQCHRRKWDDESQKRKDSYRTKVQRRNVVAVRAYRA